MVACSRTSSLLISSALSSAAIWRMDLKRSYAIVELVDKHAGGVRSMSVNDGRLLVTSYSGQSLVVYDTVSGETLSSIQLPPSIEPKHAVENEANRSVYVVHSERNDHVTTSRISEVDCRGHVIRQFRGRPDQVDLPFCYLSKVPSGGALASDTNGHVVLFDEHLNFKRMLVDYRLLDTIWLPMRLSYDNATNQLFVALRHGDVYVHKWK